MDKATMHQKATSIPTPSDSGDRRPALSLAIQPDQPLIGLPIPDESGTETFRFFADEATAESAAQPYRTTSAADLAGVWSDLDWDEMEQELDRIRHDSVPTPPIDDL